MARELTVQGKKSKEFTPVVQILQNPSMNAKLQNYIDEAVNCKQKILMENESIKTLRESAREELNIDPKVFGKLVGLYYNNNFEQQKEEAEKWELLLEALLNQRIGA
jgi:hypothetical protein